MDKKLISKGVTISFEFSPEVEKEFNEKLLALVSTEGVLYDIHQSRDESNVILSNNKNVRIKTIIRGRKVS